MTKRVLEASVLNHSRAQPGEERVPPVLAANVQRLRIQRGVSVNELARSANLDAATLEALEAGVHEPTIKTVWSLANALRVPFSALLNPASGADRTSQLPAAPSNAVQSRKVLTSSDSGRHSEIHEIKLAAHASEQLPARAKGAVENVLVTAGAAWITVDGHRQLLRTGESHSLRADVERSYASAGDSSATLYVVTSQPTA